MVKDKSTNQDPTNYMLCKNCKYFGGISNCLAKEGIKVKPDDMCSIGFFDKGDNPYEELKISKELTDAYNIIKHVLNYYLDTSKENIEIITFWIIGTYFHDSFQTFPYLFLNAMRGSGKSRTLKLITALSKGGEIMLSPTEATLFRTKGTLGIDEAERIASKEFQAVRELLNAAYKRGNKIFRMRKKRTAEGEEQVVDSFEIYRPIVLANISGMDEVLGDRCISLIFEKSNKGSFTKLIENFEQDTFISTAKNTLNSKKCCLCSDVMKKKLHKWNFFVKNRAFSHETTLYTLTTLLTITTQTTPQIIQDLELERDVEIDKDEEKLFNEIYESEIDGRNLELFFPLFMIAEQMGKEKLSEIIDIAKQSIKSKREDDFAESRDVLVYRLISGLDSDKFMKLNEMVSTLRMMMGEHDSDWINAKWLGRAIKRLNLAIESKRMNDGKYVRFNVEKAKEKLGMFE